MSKLSSVIILLVLAALVGGAVFLATWDVPPPSARVEKVIPDEKLPR
jgi:hypothetical protein